jgi:hypothetical protein
MPSKCAFLSALAAFLIGMALLPSLAAAEIQVPNPVPRPQKAPNSQAVLPVPKAAATNAKVVPTDIPGPGSYPNGRVIVLRGLANVFSRGMDAIAKDLKNRDVNVTLSNHSRWQSISAKLIQEYRANPNGTAPIILIGHSLGGDASIVMANWLVQNRVPVRLVVVFDAVAQVHPVNGGVESVTNFYKPKGYGQEIKPGSNFRGVINNVDLTDRTDIDHLNIDKDPVIQQEVIAEVMKILAAANDVKPPRKSTPVAKAPPPAEDTAAATPTTTADAAPPPAAAPPAPTTVAAEPPGSVPAAGPAAAD